MTAILEISLQLGFAYALMVYGIYLSFRVLDFPDLTVDGSFTLGGAISAILLTHGWNPVTSIVVAGVGGLVAGMFTCSLYSFLHINKILSGILALTILYSVNLRIMNAPNIPLLNVTTLNNWLERIPISTTVAVTLCYGLLAIAFKLLADWFLRTEIGILIRATGDNEQVVKCVAKNPEWFRLIGMGTANMLVALAGSLLAQNFGFADIGLGIGVIIFGFGSLLVGEAIVRPASVVSYTLAALVGSVVYQFIVAFGLRLGLAPTDLKLATGFMVIGLLAVKGKA